MPEFRTFRPWSDETKADPYTVYAWLRTEAPVQYHENLGVWTVARHHDVEYALRDWEIFSSASGITVGGFAGLKPMIILMDPPRHNELRRLLSRAFTPRRVAVLEERMRAIAADLLHPMVTAGGGDLVAQFARPYPATVIAELLGVDSGDRDAFCRWSDAIMLSGSDAAELEAAYGNIFEYFETTVSRRRRQQGEDVVSALLRGESTEGGLSEDELLGFCALLLIAGHETMTNFLSLAALTIDRLPRLHRQLVGDPSLLEAAVEELLRFEPPVHGLARTVMADVELGGRIIPKGDMVLLLLGSANRDPLAFDDPDRFDLVRVGGDNAAFGFGVHYCMGAGLARLEARVGLEELLRRMPEFTVIADPLRWRTLIPTRGPVDLPVMSGG
jgi:cytochrome P450